MAALPEIKEIVGAITEPFHALERPLATRGSIESIEGSARVVTESADLTTAYLTRLRTEVFEKISSVENHEYGLDYAARVAALFEVMSAELILHQVRNGATFRHARKELRSKGPIYKSRFLRTLEDVESAQRRILEQVDVTARTFRKVVGTNRGSGFPPDPWPPQDRND